MKVKNFKEFDDEFIIKEYENEDNYEKIIEKIAFQRKQMYSFEGKNIL